jgi:UDP-N-acetylmuramoyl-tripeptide--D-alanyl-D-alanine ligase
MDFDEIVAAVRGKVILPGKYSGYKDVCTDTRKLKQGDIFIALKGERFDGNDYAVEASRKGASICMVDEVKFKRGGIEKYTTVVKVKDGNRALLDLAELYRSKLDVKIIGVTGSAGKTTTKDMIAAVLGAKFKVLKTQGNFNNQIGLPHMLFKLDDSYKAAVLEMGMNSRGEIHNMAKAARPDAAVITNVLRAHIGILGSRENILKAKLEITDFFSKDNILIINSDNDLLGKLKIDKFPVKKVGVEKPADISAYDCVVKEDSIGFKVCENGIRTGESFKISLPGKYNILNSMLAIACGRLFGMTYDEIRRGFDNIRTTSLRMEIFRGKKFNVINDSYNANPESMEAALDVLKNFKSERRITVFGTMRELGEASHKMHEEVGEYAANSNVDLFIALGEFWEDFRKGFEALSKKGKFMFFNSKEEVLKFLLDKYIKRGDTVLVKASRLMKFEEIAEELKKNSSC